MGKLRGLVVAVSIPTVAHQPGTYQVRLAVPIKRGYATPDEGQSWFQYDRRVAKTSKRDVFLNYRPAIGTWVEARAM